jgi:hypothetical protein
MSPTILLKRKKLSFRMIEPNDRLQRTGRRLLPFRGFFCPCRPAAEPWRSGKRETAIASRLGYSDAGFVSYAVNRKVIRAPCSMARRTGQRGMAGTLGLQHSELLHGDARGKPGRTARGKKPGSYSIQIPDHKEQ